MLIDDKPKKSTSKLQTPAPRSRIEKMLYIILNDGDLSELGAPRCREEVLLMQIADKIKTRK